MLINLYTKINSFFVSTKKQEFSACPPFIDNNGSLTFKGNIITQNGKIQYNVTTKIVGLDSVLTSYGHTILFTNETILKNKPTK